MEIVLGKSFWIQCGVRQGGVLSPYLFVLYIDDVIKALRNSGYGIFVGNIFQAASCMQMILFYCHAAFVVCKKWLIFVLHMVLAGISSLTLVKVMHQFWWI